MKRVWSQSQWEVINAEDDRLLVSASAGSGKTTVMIERILNLVQKGASLSEMLICTFTKASAYDMRFKLYAEMVRRGLKNELKDLARADISTIDSFCQKLVGKYFYTLGIDPQFDVLDEAESAALKINAAEQSIFLSRENEDFKLLAKYLRRKRRNFILRQAILSYMDYVSINPDSPPCFDYDPSEVKNTIDAYLGSKKQKILAAIDESFKEVCEPEIKADLISALESGNVVFCRKKLKEANAYFKPCCDHLKERIKDYIKERNEVKLLRPQECSRGLIEAFILTARQACRIYSDEKSKRSAVDFSDLENMALSILKSDAIAEIRQKYRYVFVDEYQDINPLQETLISLVAQGNKLFMVGDLKQSIYAFRGCAPDIFKGKYDAYKSGIEGRAINLDNNYRSSKSVVDFVNNVFKVIMTEDFGGVDYKANPMSAVSDERGYVKIHLISGKEEGKLPALYSVKSHPEPPLGKAEAQAALVAYRVQKLLSEGVNFGDIAILTRSMGALESLVISMLRKINIPVSLSENAYFLSRPETGQLISYLRLIDNRRDDKAMATAMLSPIGGFNENELAKIRLEGKGLFYECVNDSGDEKVRRFLSTLDRYYELSLRVGVDELAETIVSDAGYFNYAYGLGESAAEVLDKFLEYLGTCPYKNSLAACLKHIDDHNPFAELTGLEDSVKFMTIHKSKGLEFKYVFIIGLNEPFNLKDLSGQIFVGREIAMSVFEDHETKNSDLRFVTCIRERKKQLEEELRILYVALTRAQTGLELFACVGDEKSLAAYETMGAKAVDFSESNCALKLLAPQLGLAHIYDINDVSVIEAAPRKVLFGKADADSVQKLKNYFDFTSGKSAPAKSYVSKLAHDDEQTTVMFEEEADSGEALERGNAYHRAMEAIDFSAPDLSVIPESDIKLIDSGELLTAARYMAGLNGTVYKEKPFMIKLTASEAGIEGNGTVLVQGVIDLLVIDGDSATVVDYKTGKPHGRYEEGYFKQIELYSLAVERLLGLKVKRKFLYYFDGSVIVEN